MTEDEDQRFYAQIRPDDFFEVRVRELSQQAGVAGLLGLCANYETGRWRSTELADFLFDYLPEFALEYSELRQFHAGTGRRQLRKAARMLYATDKFKRRGEFGELLLHAVCREVYGSEPAISKIFFKGSVNETVHGFDGVHIVAAGKDLELLFGEVKFYASASSAITAIVPEIQEHVEADWLRRECMLIANRLDDQWPHTSRVRELISERQTLDRVFRAIRVPALITYDSKCVGAHESEAAPYPEAFDAEIRALHGTFSDAGLPERVIVDLIAVPVLNKAELVKELDRKLRIFQQI